MLGLVLGDQFETDKGDYVVTGIQFKGGKRVGCLIKPYRVENDEHTAPSFLSDEQIEKNWNSINYKGNKVL